MILGIDKVIPASQMVAGRFYLHNQYQNSPILCLCVEGLIKGVRAQQALIFDPAAANPIVFETLPDHGPVVQLPEVHVRIDAPSFAETSFTSSIRAPMLIVLGNVPYVAGLTGWRGCMIANMMTGEIVNLEDNNWASFKTWQLVIEDGGEEIPIASFGVPDDQMDE